MELQESPKTDPKIDQKNDQKMIRFWCHFGSTLAPQIGHFWGQFSVFFGTSRQERPKSAPRGAKSLQKGSPRAILGAKVGHFGAQEAPKCTQESPR